jgi:hypothetical protein
MRERKHNQKRHENIQLSAEMKLGWKERETSAEGMSRRGRRLVCSNHSEMRWPQHRLCCATARCYSWPPVLRAEVLPPPPADRTLVFSQFRRMSREFACGVNRGRIGVGQRQPIDTVDVHTPKGTATRRPGTTEGETGNNGGEGINGGARPCSSSLAAADGERERTHGHRGRAGVGGKARVGPISRITLAHRSTQWMPSTRRARIREKLQRSSFNPLARG